MLRALNEVGVDYMITGSLATNLYAVPRSTKDADIVVSIQGDQLNAVLHRLPPDIQLDPQMKFETITMTTRYDLVVKGTPFRIELFFLTDDPHNQERFRRRMKGVVAGEAAWVPAAEDVLIQKIRWTDRAKRTKDIDDARNIIEVQMTNLDWPYIETWCEKHGTLETLREVRREAEELMGDELTS